MNTKYLFQALKFACLPTLSLLVLLFFAFFSITDTLAFISSSNPWAITIRIVCFLAEIVLVFKMYSHYEYEDIIALKKKTEETEGRVKSFAIDGYYLYQAFTSLNWKRDDGYMVHQTNNENIIMIERNPKKS